MITFVMSAKKHFVVFLILIRKLPKLLKDGRAKCASFFVVAFHNCRVRYKRNEILSIFSVFSFWQVIKIHRIFSELATDT